MKRIITAIMILLACVIVCEASADEDKKIPQYLLVIRYWGHGIERGPDGFSMISKQGWIYLNETYQSLDDIILRLETYTGRGMSIHQKENELVGLWKLGDEKNIADKVLEVEEIRHEKKVEVRTKEWIEIIWRKKP